MNTLAKLHEFVLYNGPESWIQGQLACDSAGEAIWPCHINACKWCLLGAAYRVYMVRDLEHYLHTIYTRLMRMKEAADFEDASKEQVITHMNDYVLTYPDILDLLAQDDAIAISSHIYVNKRPQNPTSIDELAKAQNVKPMPDVRALFGTWPGHKADRFEEAVDELRHQL